MWSSWRKIRPPRGRSGTPSCPSQAPASQPPVPPLRLPQLSTSPSPASSPFILRTSSSVKDVRVLLSDDLDLDLDSDDHSNTPSCASPSRCPSPVLHRVRSASSAVRHYCAPPDDLFGLSPGEQKRVVLYFTSLHVVRRTFDECYEVRTILSALRVAIDERDVFMDASFLRELKTILGSRRGQLTYPQVFIGGRHFGGSDEIRRLYETGELSRYVEGVVPAPAGPCEACGNFRFVICRCCSGSRRVYSDKGGGRSRTCTACNENGIVRCTLCSVLFAV